MSNKLKNGLLGAVAAGALGTAAMMSDTATQGVAEWLAGDTPEMPVRGPAKRNPINVAFGIDGSASKIRHKVATAVQSTADFVDNGGLLADGDNVKFCEIGGAKGGAGPAVQCQNYTLPTGEAALLADINDTQSPHYSTHVLQALDVMTDLEAPCAAAAWTDAITEEKQDGQVAPRVDLGSCELKMLIPDAEYQKRAEAICASMQQPEQCEVVLATSAADVEKALSGVVSKVQAEAQAEADALAEAELAKAMEEYERQRAALKAQAEQYKSTARTVVGVGFAAFLAAVASLAAYINRPIVKGQVITKTTKGKVTAIDLEASYGKGRVNLREEASNLPNVVFKATWTKGLLVNGRPVPSEAHSTPVEVSEGVFYSTEVHTKKSAARKAAESALKGGLTDQE